MFTIQFSTRNAGLFSQRLAGPSRNSSTPSGPPISTAAAEADAQHQEGLADGDPQLGQDGGDVLRHGPTPCGATSARAPPGARRCARIAFAAAHQRIDLAAQRGRRARRPAVIDRELLDQPALLEDRDVAAQRLDHRQLVRDDDDGHAELLVDVAQRVEQRARGLAVERRGGLVAQQHLRAAAPARGRSPRAASGRRRAGPGSCRSSRPGRPASRHSRTRASISAREWRPWIFSGKATLSNTVAFCSRLNCWKIMPMFWRVSRSSRRDSVVRSRPPTSTLPASGRSSRLISRSSVDLPAPLLPIRPKMSPCVDVERQRPHGVEDLAVGQREGLLHGFQTDDGRRVSAAASGEGWLMGRSASGEKPNTKVREKGAEYETKAAKGNEEKGGCLYRQCA